MNCKYPYQENEQAALVDLSEMQNNASDIEKDIIAANNMYLDSEDTINNLPTLNIQPLIQFITSQ